MKKVSLLLIIFLPFHLFAAPQDSVINSAYYENAHLMPVWDYAVFSGKVTPRFLLNQPFRAGLFADYMRSQSKGTVLEGWRKSGFADLARYAAPAGVKPGYGQLYLSVQPGYRLMDDAGRGEGQFTGAVEGVYISKNLVLVNKTITDQAYKADPAFFGDTTSWIWGRSSSSYAVIDLDPFEIFAGRMRRNWGLPGETSLILSKNAHAFDHLSVKYKSRRFQFTFLVSRLEDKWAYDSQAVDSSRVWSKRYISMQRGDLRLSDKLQIGFTQVALYGGENRTFEFGYLNPMNLFYVVQRNNRSQINGLWCADIVWRPKENITLFGQLMIDDIIINNSPDKKDRERSPDRHAVTVKGVWADGLLKGSLISASFTHVTNWNYQSFRTWENYTFFDQSLGFPVNSFEGIRLDFSYVGMPPLIFQASAGHQRRGDMDITAVFRGEKTDFPYGTAEHITWAEGTIRYIPCRHWHARLRIRYDQIVNHGHISGKTASPFYAMLEMHLNLDKVFVL